MASITMWSDMANWNLLSNQYSWSDHDQTLFVILVIFLLPQNVDHLLIPVESGKDVVWVWCNKLEQYTVATI